MKFAFQWFLNKLYIKLFELLLEIALLTYKHVFNNVSIINALLKMSSCKNKISSLQPAIFIMLALLSI